MARRGWRRQGTRRFSYVDARGRPIDDPEALERVRALAIPPAWEDVWISPSPAARLQATGVDAAGRKQYLYHASYRSARERAKFERLALFAQGLPKFRARVDRHLRLGPYEPEWASAVAIGLINKAWFRVGSDRHARRSRTYGVTTLAKGHVTVSDDEVTFAFRAKNSKLVRRTLRSVALARGVNDLLELDGGSRLFRFERDGELVNLTSAVLNAYLGEHLGNGFTAKDFRTWGGTLLAAAELERRGAPSTNGEARRSLAAVMRTVGDELGNTAAIARASYVSPVVVEHYRAGRTLGEFRPDNGVRRRHLTVDEQALVAMLRSQPT